MISNKQAQEMADEARLQRERANALEQELNAALAKIEALEAALQLHRDVAKLLATQNSLYCGKLQQIATLLEDL